jgi:OFA family oxalate/formate antiporter-like MFS transporter
VTTAQTIKPSSPLVLLASITLTTVLGSIHAFSVFLPSLENLLQADRSQISLIYSGALICLTISVLCGHRIYSVVSPPLLALIACFVAAIGIVIAGQSQSFWLTVLGYSVIFGGANGVGYGFALQISAQAMPTRRGLAMGAVTAFYALGATIAPFVFNHYLMRGGVPAAMTTAGFIILIAGFIAWALLHRSGIRFRQEPRGESSPASHSVTLQRLLWLAYGSGAMAGLMVIGHATGIVLAAGGTVALAIGGAMVIAFGNMLGGLAAGVLSDRIRLSTLLTLLPLISALVLTISAASSNALLLLISLILVGFCYGSIIAVYPVAVIKLFGEASSSRIYGRVFTAWGLAGLLGPWLAGLLYDITGGYTLAMLAAATSSALSVLVAYLLNSHPEFTLANRD